MQIGTTIRQLFTKRSFQTLYLLLLITLVPLMIILNTIVVIGDFQDTITTELQRKALLTANIIDISNETDIEDVDLLQKKIEEIATIGEELQAIDILIPYENEFQVIASLEPEVIGATSNQTQLTIAWQREEAIAHQTTAETKTSLELLSTAANSGEQNFWIVTKPLLDNEETSVALLSIKLSSEIVDNLVVNILTKSYTLLTLTVLLTLAVIAAISQIFKTSGILRRKVGQLDDIKSNFITVVSHVMRTPLNGMAWNLELLLSGDMGELSEEQENFLRTTYKNNQTILQTIEDLIVAMDIEQKTLEPKPEKTQILGLVDSILIDLKHSVIAKKLHIDFKKPEGLPELIVDPKLIGQAIYKIIDNSVKYSNEEGSIKIRTALEKTRLTIIVEDTGVGIPKDEQDKIFDKFYRGRKALKLFTDAAGLGLFVAQHIIKIHGGEIQFDSTEGQGSRFYITLPVIP